MKVINFTGDPHKQKHFDFFRKMAQPHFGITAEVDITLFAKVVRESPTLRFTPALVYLITKAALEVVPFRWRLRGGEVVEHANLRPSFTVPTARSSAFSFCTVAYEPNPVDFHAAAELVMEKMKDDPSLEDEHGADDYLFLSSFPWARFTSVTHAMPGAPDESIPRIVWGKYRKVDNKVLLPLAVQAHHALVDGSDMGKFYQIFEKSCAKANIIFSDFTKKLRVS